MPHPDTDPRLQHAGLRQTQAARALLRWFDAHPQHRATHAEVLAGLGTANGTVPNRVTVYRVLDKLASAGVLTRHADEATRAWRYALTPPTDGKLTPRFECDACHHRFELTEANGPTQQAAHALMETLAALGHHAQRVELAVHGTCAGCQPPA